MDKILGILWHYTPGDIPPMASSSLLLDGTDDADTIGYETSTSATATALPSSAGVASGTRAMEAGVGGGAISHTALSRECRLGPPR